MKHIYGMAGIILACCVLVSCAAAQTPEREPDASYSVDGQTSMAESAEKAPQSPEDGAAADEADSHGYKAAKKSGFVEETDKETCVLMCQNACGEFMRAKRKNALPDFSDYITNPNLLEYMNYKVEYYPGNFHAEHCELKDAEFSAEDGYACLKAVVSSGQSSYGTITFLLKNEDGRIWISEWYSYGLDYLDFKCDGRNAYDYSVRGNADFWDNPDKYEPILNQLRRKQ